MKTRCRGLAVFGMSMTLVGAMLFAEDAALPESRPVELQPLAAQAARVAEALDRLGSPLAAEERTRLKAARSAKEIQTILDRRCLAAVTLDKGKPGLTVKAQRGPAAPELAEQGWRVFLIKVYNPKGVEGVRLQVTSPSALPLTRRSTSKPDPTVVSVGEVGKRFLDILTFDSQPLVAPLSGLEVEYRIVSLYSRDAGRKEARLGFRVMTEGKKAFASEEIPYLFEAAPASLVRFRVKDYDGASVRHGRPVMASFTIRDELGRVYPSPARRLAPDFNFHFQIYRADGETVPLQPGTYTVTWTRGPEYRELSRKITVPPGSSHTESFTLERWVHPAKKGWWSGDHHIHAAGCSHYESPTEGVTPEDMMRHILGEDLNVGCCLSWGPCWYHQKRYFSGKVHDLSTPDNLLRYDVEVSGFPSSHCGHICLLNLREQDYPGTRLIEDWPSWDLPVFAWARKQGGVIGFAHTGWGLDVGPTRELPNLIVPPMNSIGANEYLVDVAHGLCDFLSTVDTPAIWELNIWYHTLNCGYRCRVSGETDFPCIYGERVGIGRSYIQLDGKLDFTGWVEGLRKGRSYVSDGKSHLLDFQVHGLGVGQKDSEIRLEKPGKVEVTATVAALLEPKPTPVTEKVRNAPWNARPYWDLERCRVGATRKVPVELVVNGLPVDRVEIVADGSEQPVKFTTQLTQSSWVALRVLPSSHTNPVFVVIDGKPIRTSKKSAQWCLAGIDKCWEQKKNAIRAAERPAAEKAYEEARAAYRKILAECAGE